jgi:hypothetical protein
MAVNDKLRKEFLEALDDAETMLNKLLFKKHCISQKGLAYFIEYRKENDTRVKFLFGPADWDIEMIIYTSIGKFSFKDLLGFPAIKMWVNDNGYRQHSDRNLRSELFWFVELLKISLPIIE